MTREFQIDAKWCHRPCPACGTGLNRPLFSKEGVPFVECCECRTVYVNPTPPIDLLHDLYQELGQRYLTDIEKVRLETTTSRFRREIAIIPSSVRRGRLLDVGCATGTFLARARDLGFSVVSGVDISRPAVAVANQLLGPGTVVAGDFLDLCFDPESWDVVTIWATLEHVPDPVAWARQAWRVLRPGGHLFASVPHRNGISMRFLRVKWHMVGLEHLNYFTSTGMQHLLTRGGFSVHRCRVLTVAFNPIVFWKDWRGRHLSGQFSCRDLIADGAANAALLRYPLVSLVERLLDSVLATLGIGDLMICIAQKE